jgi:tripartite-type tricarboxylate transporter receptor subunit TctC
VSTWWGLSAPAKTPPAILARLHKETVSALNSPDVRSRLEELGAEIIASSPAQYADFIRRDMAKWAKVIKAAGIKSR